MPDPTFEEMEENFASANRNFNYIKNTNTVTGYDRKCHTENIKNFGVDASIEINLQQNLHTKNRLSYNYLNNSSFQPVEHLAKIIYLAIECVAKAIAINNKTLNGQASTQITLCSKNQNGFDIISVNFGNTSGIIIEIESDDSANEENFTVSRLNSTNKIYFSKAAINKENITLSYTQTDNDSLIILTSAATLNNHAFTDALLAKITLENLASAHNEYTNLAENIIKSVLVDTTNLEASLTKEITYEDRSAIVCNLTQLATLAANKLVLLIAADGSGEQGALIAKQAVNLIPFAIQELLNTPHLNKELLNQKIITQIKEIKADTPFIDCNYPAFSSLKKSFSNLKLDQVTAYTANNPTISKALSLPVISHQMHEFSYNSMSQLPQSDSLPLTPRDDDDNDSSFEIKQSVWTYVASFFCCSKNAVSNEKLIPLLPLNKKSTDNDSCCSKIFGCKK